MKSRQTKIILWGLLGVWLSVYSFCQPIQVNVSQDNVVVTRGSTVMKGRDFSLSRGV